MLWGRVPPPDSYLAGGCRRSRGCFITESADGRFVVEATMGSLVVIEVGPGL